MRLHTLLLFLLIVISDAAAFTSRRVLTRSGVRSSRIVCSSASGGPVLTGSQKRALRSHAGRLAAAKTLLYVNVASSPASAEEVDRQLEKHELVRCKFQVLKKAEAKEMASQLAGLTSSTVAEVLGHTALLYRPSEQRLISLE